MIKLVDTARIFAVRFHGWAMPQAEAKAAMRLLLAMSESSAASAMEECGWFPGAAHGGPLRGVNLCISPSNHGWSSWDLTI